MKRKKQMIVQFNEFMNLHIFLLVNILRSDSVFLFLFVQQTDV